ncbi:MAG: phosphoribosylamine--glycine ligase, partial [Myxococcales bacterium]
HALAWKVASDPRVDTVLAAPGSAGIAQVADCVDVAVDDIDGLAALARDAAVDLTIVGPEAPLAAGLVDRFRADGLRVFGPDASGARLEASKAFTKQILVDAGVPTAVYGEFSEAAPARAFARELGAPLVVKADGLAAGKGVVICSEIEEADAAITSMLEGGAFGEAGSRVVVEEFLEGEEASFIALTDGRNIVALAPSQDHKAVFDGDHGPNTGGMGAYSPAPVVTAEIEAEITSSIIEPTVATLRDRGIDYRGVLYAGLMIRDGRPKVLEYNVRFGDPECQPLMLRLRSSLVDLVEACVDGDLAGARVEWNEGAAVCLVLASGGYPGPYERGKVISGIEEAAASSSVEVFHAGTSRDAAGNWITSGGRVLGVTAGAGTIDAAVDRAYEAAAQIEWEGMHYRRDIAHRARTI